MLKSKSTLPKSPYKTMKQKEKNPRNEQLKSKSTLETPSATYGAGERNKQEEKSARTSKHKGQGDDLVT